MATAQPLRVRLDDLHAQHAAVVVDLAGLTFVAIAGITACSMPVTPRLAQLVGATRSAVTTGLGRLERRGALSRPAENAWLLHDDPPSFAAPA